MGGNLNGIYVKKDNGKEVLIDLPVLNYYLEPYYALENSCDSKIRALALDFKSRLSELFSKSILIDFTGLNDYKEKITSDFLISKSKSPIFIFEPSDGFKIIENEIESKIKINYAFDKLKSRVEYI